MQWEYAAVTEPTVNINTMVARLNGLGSLGWEVVGITSNDPSIGLNIYTALLKRPVSEWPAPADTTPAWQSDPAGRFPRRYWDGSRWSHNVLNDKNAAETDYPTRSG